MANILVRTVDCYGIREKVCRHLNLIMCVSPYQLPWHIIHRLVGLPPIMPATMTQR